MLSSRRDYLIAWVLPSFGQQTIAQHYLDHIDSHYSSTCHVTYTFGRVGSHDVVLASPAADIDAHNTDYIIGDLLQYAPSIRAGFLVSSDAIAPRSGCARVGDIVVGGTLPLMQRGVIHFDVEETTNKKRLVITGESRNVSPSVAEAVINARSSQGLKDWKGGLCGHMHSSDTRRDVGEDGEPQLAAPLQGQHKVLLGVIASSTQPIKDFELLSSIAARENILCFETAGASLNYGPFLVVAGIARCSDDVPGHGSHEETGKAVISYLACLVKQMEHPKLALEPLVELQFRYKPLDLGQPRFRLLRLQGGTGRLECEVFEAYLDVENIIPYEALSYCWGSNHIADTIGVNGKAFTITSNLCLALEHLRLPDRDRILWIDAICIDQANVRERGHQVNQMGDVYRHAEQVLFWLGSVDYDVVNLLWALQRFERHVPDYAWKRWLNEDNQFQGIWGSIQGSSNDRNLSRSSQQSRLKVLMNNEWFGRVWVIQEVSNARRAMLGCTEGWINARTFALAPILLGVEPSTQCQAVIDVMPGPSRRSSWWNQKPNLSTLLWKFRESQATEPKDRVFALLDISSDRPFKTDYTKSEKNVCHDLIEYMRRDEVEYGVCKYPYTYSSIAEVQNLIPDLLYMNLDHFSGGSAHAMEVFNNRHNKQVFLSEVVVSYLWFTKSSLQQQLMDQSSIIHVVSDETSKEDVSQITEPLAAYLKRNKGPKATGPIVDALRRFRLDFVTVMLAQDLKDIEVDDALAIQAVKKGPSFLQQFLRKYGEKVMLTRRLIDTAAENGKSIHDILFDEYNSKIKITDDLVLDAMERSSETVQLLFDMYRDQVEISERAILEAMKYGPEMLGLLLEACGRQFNITQTLAIAAIEHGSHTFKLLLDRYGDRLEIDRAITLAAVKKGSDTFKLLADRYESEIMFTDDMVDLAFDAGSQMLEIILDRYGDRITVTDDMIYRAIDQGLHHILKILLDRCGNQIMCTNAMVREALEKSPGMFKVIMDTYGGQIEINDVVDISFYCSSDPERLRALFDRCGDSIQLPQNVLNIMSQLRREDNLYVLLNRYCDRDDVVRALARIENRWALLIYIIRSMIVRKRLTVDPWLRVLVFSLGGVLAQRFGLFAMIMAGDFNELLLDPRLLLEPA